MPARDVGKEFAAGATIAGRYLIEERIGAGAMGVVLRARDERLRREVAMKVLPAEAVGDASSRARFLSEARAAAALEHPGIVHVYDVGETDDGSVYYVMELVRGETLRSLLERRSLDPAACVRAIVEAARALAHAHRRGFVHRDVKPDNLMIRDDGRVVVLDFGIAKQVAAELASTVAGDAESTALATATGAIVGTPAYLAPEQALGRPIDARADQFALAVTAYEILTGRRPWTGASMAEMLAQIARDEPPRPSSVADLPAAVDAVFARAMAKDPKDRFDDAEAFADALAAAFARDDTALAETAIADTVAAKVEPKPRRASPIAKAAIAIAGVGIAIGAAWRNHTRFAASHPDGGASPATAVDGASTKLACPPLEVAGAPEPSGWLGAAAASLACTRAQIMLGGSAERTLVPAELLGLDKTPMDALPSTPYEPAGPVRARALAAARERATARIDGRVDVQPSGFRVGLALFVADAKRVEASGEAASLDVAVSQAMQRIGAEPPFRGAKLDPAIASLVGVASVDAALAALDVAIAGQTEAKPWIAEACARAEHRPDARALPPFVAASCARRLYRDEPPARADDTLASIPWTSVGPPGRRSSTLDAEAMRRHAAALRAKAASEPSADRRALFRATEAALRQSAGDLDEAYEVATRSVHDDPKSIPWRDDAWTTIVYTAPDASVARAAVAWQPWNPHAQAFVRRIDSAPDAQVAAAQRAFMLAPHGYWATSLGELLLVTGRRLEAQGIAAHAEDDVLRVEIEASEARFAAALARVERRIRELPATDEASVEAFQLARLGVVLARLLGRRPDFVGDVVARYVDPEPPALDGGIVAFVGVALACTLAPKDVARRCIERLRAIASAHASFGLAGADAALEGALAYTRGDLAKAADAWRPLARKPDMFLVQALRLPIVDALDKRGEAELADRIDAPVLALGGLYDGVDPAHVRAARRREQAGDRVGACALAEKVVDAWSAADAKVPLVDEMRAIRTRTCGPR